MEAILGWHAPLGLTVIVLNLAVGLVLMRARRNRQGVSAAYRVLAYLGQAALAVQVLIGLDLWSRGARPAPGFWAWLHLLFPIGALIFNVIMLLQMRKRPAEEHATLLSKGAWHTASVALVTYLIGYFG